MYLTIQGQTYLTSESRHLQVVHFGQQNKKGEIFVVHTQFERGTTSDDLQLGEDYPLDIYVGDKNIAGHLEGRNEKGEIE